MHGGRLIDLGRDRSALRAQCEIAWIHFENRIHLHEAKNDAVARWHAATTEPSARSSGDDGDFVLCGDFYTCGDLHRILWKNHGSC